MIMLMVSIVDASTVNRELLDIPFGQRVIERPPLARRAEPRSALRGPTYFGSLCSQYTYAPHPHPLRLQETQGRLPYI